MHFEISISQACRCPFGAGTRQDYAEAWCNSFSSGAAGAGLLCERCGQYRHRTDLHRCCSPGFRSLITWQLLGACFLTERCARAFPLQRFRVTGVYGWDGTGRCGRAAVAGSMAARVLCALVWLLQTTSTCLRGGGGRSGWQGCARCAT